MELKMFTNQLDTRPCQCLNQKWMEDGENLADNPFFESNIACSGSNFHTNRALKSNPSNTKSCTETQMNSSVKNINDNR